MEEFECEEDYSKDERHRRVNNGGNKGRQNAAEVAKREEKKAQRQAQRDGQVIDNVSDNEIEEEEVGKKKKSKKLGESSMSKEEKQKLYDLDMEQCAKLTKGKKAKKN